MVSVIGDSTLDDVVDEELPASLDADDLTPIEGVTQNLRGLFQGFTKFDDVFLVGEVGDYNDRTDHLYFSLNAAYTESKINCIVYANVRNQLDVEIEPETLVAAKGELTFYEPAGYPSLAVESAHLVGESAYWQRIAALKEQLAEDGLFDAERKTDLPTFPQTVGIVTAADSDAEQDLVDTIHSRYPDVDLLLQDSTVQGSDAPTELKAAIEAVDDSPADVLVVARGGGSETALRTFNAEPVVRAVADAETPTVAAIGHDADEPLVDEVADERAKTPTAAGEVVVPEKATYRDELTTAREDIQEAYTVQTSRWLAEAREEVDQAAERLCADWLDVETTAVESEYARLVGGWLDRTTQGIETAAAGLTKDWLNTNRAIIDQRAGELSETWLSAHRRDVQTAYADLAGGWVEDHRQAIEQEYQRIDREHSLQTEKEGLERTNKLLVAIIIVLLLLFLGAVAVALGIV